MPTFASAGIYLDKLDAHNLISFGPATTTTMTTPILNAYRVSDRYAAVRLRVPLPIEPREENPIHLAILLDVSGSMEGPRLDAVKRTLYAARDLFQETDRVTLVVFYDVATTVAAGLRMTDENKDRFYERLARITAQGCTNLSAGLEKLMEVRQTAVEPYTNLVILTDGHINRGIVTNTGLRTLVDGLGRNLPVTTLGYGAEHNRILLRDLALDSRGSYTYVDSDETLPVVMGDLLAGQRSLVLRGASIDLDVQDGDAHWVSAELGGDGARHVVGDVVPDRDYWIVYQNNELPQSQQMTVTLRALNGLGVLATADVLDVAPDEAEEQVFRCRVAAVSAAITNVLERSQRPESAYRIQLSTLQTAIEQRIQTNASPLLYRLRAQVAELLEAVDTALSQPEQIASTPTPTLAPSAWDSPPGPNSIMLARLSSNTAQLSLQRGVSSAPADADVDDPAPLNMFSSPIQVAASSTCRETYTRNL